LDTLVRLFLIGIPVEREAAGRAVEPMQLEEWHAARLVRVEGDSVHPAVIFIPFWGLLLAADVWSAAPRQDYVMCFGASSVTVADLTVRRPSRRTLDVAAGNGLHALLAAAHSDRVVAVDCNPRAVHFAAINAQLNGLANVQVRQGDFFEPVRGEKFDLVISNPPYVISPETHSFVTASGLPEDQLCQRIIREVPPLLRDGGFCQFRCEWAHVAGQDWQERLAGWFAGTGCDAWVIRHQTRDPGSYASDWIRETEVQSGEPAAERFERWIAYFARQRIEALSTGCITLRCRRGGTNWFRCDEAPELAGPAGAPILRGFALRDFLDTVSDDGALLSARLRLAPELRWEEHREPAAGGWRPTRDRLYLPDGLAAAADADTRLVALVGRCRGERPLRDLLSEVASTMGRSLEQIEAEGLAVVRRLIEQGFLWPVAMEIVQSTASCRYQGRSAAARTCAAHQTG
jgi:methylase of polypeptide subunit release factors